MRRGLTHVLLAGFLVAGGGACARDDGAAQPGVSPAASASGLAVRTVQAGPVEVTVTLVRIDETGALLEVGMNTHSVELDADLTTARLAVDGVDWGVPEWSGDGPTGHHRSGELRFKAAGPARATARLTLEQLPEPVSVSWAL